jgi:hypothetical protein
MKTIILEEELLRIKEIMGVNKDTISESSEVMPKSNPVFDYIKSIVDASPEMSPKQFCSGRKFNKSRFESKAMNVFRSLFGEQGLNIFTQIKNKISKMDSNSILNFIKTLRGLLKNPNEFKSYIKKFLGMESPTPVNESVELVLAGFFMLLVLCLLILDTIYGGGGDFSCVHF